MKRAGNLIERIVDAENLRRAYLRAVAGKRDKPETLHFRENLDANLAALGRELAEGRYRWGVFSRFKIYDPKEREIAVAPFRDRVAHHAIIGVCEPIFERRQIDQSFACRKGKGQSAAVALAQTYSRGARYYLKMDVRKYFASIDRETLKRSLFRLFKDETLLKALRDVVDAYEPGAERGLPIGSLTSQFFANHYLTPLDRFIKERLKARRYLRYMDDFVLWDDDRDVLSRQRDEIERFAAEELLLTFKESALNLTSKGLTFLGTRVFPGRVRLASRSRLRFRRKYAELTERFRQGLATETEYAERTRALFAFVERAESRAFRLRVMQTGDDAEGLEPGFARR